MSIHPCTNAKREKKDLLYRQGQKQKRKRSDLRYSSQEYLSTEGFLGRNTKNLKVPSETQKQYPERDGKTNRRRTRTKITKSLEQVYVRDARVACEREKSQLMHGV